MRLKCLWLTGLLWMLLQPPAVAGPEFGSGELQRQRQHISRMASLSLVQDKLRLDREAWSRYAGWSEQEARSKGQRYLNEHQSLNAALSKEEDAALRVGQMLAARTLIERFQAAVRPQNPNVLEYEDRVEFNFYTTSGLNCQMRINYRSNEFYIRIQENMDPNHTLQVQDIGGRLSVQISVRNGEIQMDLTQEREGAISVSYGTRIDKDGNRVSAENYYQLLEKNADLMATQAFPLMEAVGLSVPLTIFDPVVVDAALSLSVDVSGDVREEVLTWIRRLDDVEFEVRQNASRRVGELFQQYSEIVVDLAQGDWPPETRTRLQSIINLVPRRSEAQDLARREGLARNLDYFLKALPLVSGEREQRTIRVLQELTGKKFTTSEEWQAWAGTR